MCRLRLGWDEQATGPICQVWKQWISELPRLTEISIPRCYKPCDFDAVTSCQLHIFADASNQGYGVAAYLRFTTDVDRIHCILIMSKARVAPLKHVTIPRLELTAACVAVRMAHVIKKELHYELNKTYFWTDSMSTIRYIQNESSRFRTFVANRIEVIRDGSEPSQWQYVPTQSNPANAASRGLNYDAFVRMDQWFHGPSFLWNPESMWPSCNEPPEISTDDPEVKKTVSAAVTSECVDSVERLLHYCSSWMKLKRIVSVYLLLKETLQRKVHEKQNLKSHLQQEECTMFAKETTYLMVPMLQKAERAIIQYVQKKHFPQLLHTLQGSSSGRCELDKQVRKQDPVLVNGVIRVGGRLSNALIPYEVKHPVLLPKTSHVSQLIVKDCHKCFGHMGRAAMLSQLRQQYWIIGAGYLIKRIISRCIVCRKYSARQKLQKMADIPFDRLNPDEPPFSSVGVDFFGPFYVKRGRVSVNDMATYLLA